MVKDIPSMFPVIEKLNQEFEQVDNLLALAYKSQFKQVLGQINNPVGILETEIDGFWEYPENYGRIGYGPGGALQFDIVELADSICALWLGEM